MNPDNDSNSRDVPSGDRRPGERDEHLAVRLADLHEKLLAAQGSEAGDISSWLSSVSSAEIDLDGTDRPMASLVELLSALDQMRTPRSGADSNVDDRGSTDHAVVETLPQSGEQDRGSDGNPPPLAEASEQQPASLETHVDRNRMEGGGLTGDGDAAIGLQVGRFKVRSRIGQGGFGMVFEAYDDRLDRMVALKIPRAEAILSPAHRRRFLRESRAAAALSHPNIVGVLESGTDGPICYIASDYVQGVSLAEWKKSRPQCDPTLVAQIMVQLSDAMQHAHSRHVLHRDLKPNNILMSGDTPRITDFGLAARLDQTDESLTGDSLVGTPAFMSPEQASGSETVDPRTDIYSLGAVLYFLLAGRPPFSGKSPLEVLDQVRHREPLPPRSIHPATPLDLQSICLKCLEKEPSRRYSTAHELREDLQRYLGGVPVTARPLSRRERLVRWSRRNPAVSALGAAAIVGFILALTATTWGWLSTSHALGEAEVARAEAVAALGEADIARAEAVAARGEADLRYLASKQTVDQFFTSVAENDLLHVPGLTPLRHEFLRAALEHYEVFLDEKGDDDSLLSEIERSHYRLGVILRDLGQLELALSHFQESGDLLERLLEQGADDESLRVNLNATLAGISSVQALLGRHDDALAVIERAVADQQSLFDSHPTNPAIVKQLADLLQRRGNLLRETRQLAEAQAAFVTAVQLLDELMLTEAEDVPLRRELNQALGNLSNVLRMTGQLEAADELAQRVIDDRREIAAHAEGTLADQRSLLMSLHNRALLLLSQRRDFEVAQQLLEEAAEIADFLAAVFPHSESHVEDPATVRGLLAVALVEQRKIEPALENFRLSEYWTAELVNINPDSAALQFSLAVAQLNYGASLADHTDRFDEARSMLSGAGDLAEQQLAAMPESIRLISVLLNSEVKLAELARREQNWSEARNHLQRGHALLAGLDEGLMANPQFANSARALYQVTADVHEKSAEYAEAVTWWRNVIEATPPPRDRLARLRLAAALALSGDIEQAITELDSVAEDTTDVAQVIQRGRIAALIATQLSNAGSSDSGDPLDVDPAEIEQWQQRAIASFAEAIELDLRPRDIDYLLTSHELDDLRSLAEFESILDAIDP